MGAAVVERFAEWAVAARAAPLPEAVLHHAKRAAIDFTAAMIAGARSAPAALLERALAEELDRGGARLALGRRASVRAAALLNGTAAHAMEVDDIYREGIFHPGAPTIAAALAVGQSQGASGLSFLRALVVGYEIGARIAEAMGRAHYRYWHATGTIGGFGACAAAAELLELDAARFAHALATAATFAAGLQQAMRGDSTSKPLHAGRAAEAGLLAALAAREGARGALDALEGEAGLGAAMGDAPDWGRALAALGGEFRIARITFKNHACCGHAFAAIDGALALRARLGVGARDIARVRVATYRAALEVAGHDDPRTAAEARFSLRYAVAHALAHGSVRLAAFEPARLADPRTRDLMRRIEIAVDPELDRAFPARRAARVAIETADGRRAEHLQPTRVGDPEQPLSDAQLEDKFLELVAPVLGEDEARARLARLWRLEEAPALA
ncbi:MAG: MmgE/PrpD family protein [Burkholderiales bacterium]|nr:MmgE/PrpD family protein [Burkholderiales bacterium]